MLIVEPDEDEDRCQEGDDTPNPHEGQVGHQQWDLEMELILLSTDATLRTSLSSTFLQTLPDLVTPLKGPSLSLHSCPPMGSAPSERFGY